MMLSSLSQDKGMVRMRHGSGRAFLSAPESFLFRFYCISSPAILIDFVYD